MARSRVIWSDSAAADAQAIAAFIGRDSRQYATAVAETIPRGGFPAGGIAAIRPGRPEVSDESILEVLVHVRPTLEDACSSS